MRSLGLAATAKRQPSYDVNVMLEHIWVQFADCARINVVVPNPEFFDRHDVAALPLVDKVWAKTSIARSIFAQLGCSVTLIGFDSEDRKDEHCAPEKIFLQLAGSSSLKGTTRLLEVWSRHPEWPELLVVGKAGATGLQAANIRICAGYLADDEVKRLQNRCAVHICTSETEGWGHYLVEALGVGALVITLDAPPMNELVTRDRGWLLSCRASRHQGLAQRYLFDEAALVSAVEQINEMPEQAVRAVGARARSWFLDNKKNFNGRISRAVHELRV